MALTINAKSYTANIFNPSSVGYFGPLKTVSVKDDTKLAFSVPKPTDVFSGLARSQAKLTRTFTLTGAKTATGDAILTIDVAVPVGYASADVDTLLNDAGAFLASATYKTLVKNSQISY